MQVKRVGKPRDKHFFVLNAAITFGPCSFFFNTNLHNLLSSLETRLFNVYDGERRLPPLDPHPRAWQCDQFTKFLMARASRVTPLSREASCSRFKGPRRAAYQKALEKINCRGFRRSDMVVKCFLKAEPYDKLSTTDRIIRGRSPEANIVFGQIMYPLFPVLKTAIDDYFRQEYGFTGPICVTRMSAARLCGGHTLSISVRCECVTWSVIGTIFGSWSGERKVMFVLPLFQDMPLSSTASANAARGIWTHIWGIR